MVDTTMVEQGLPCQRTNAIKVCSFLASGMKLSMGSWNPYIALGTIWTLFDSRLACKHLQKPEAIWFADFSEAWMALRVHERGIQANGSCSASLWFAPLTLAFQNMKKTKSHFLRFGLARRHVRTKAKREYFID